MPEFRDETEKILLDHFFTRQRISVAEFETILWQGTQSIPLHLEELPRLKVIKTSAQKWRNRADEFVRLGPLTTQLWLTFKTINEFGENVGDE